MGEGWLSLHVILVIFHVLGSILAAGAAFSGDIIFLTTAKHKLFTASDIRILNTISNVVWIGLLIILISGVGLALQRADIFLHSGKFWAKMTVLGIIVINGIVFHFKHQPVFARAIDKPFSANSEIIRKRLPIILSGAISVLSWNFVIVLGVLGRTPFSYWHFLGVYVALAIVACTIAMRLQHRFLSP